MVEIDSKNLPLSSDARVFRQQAAIVLQSMRDELDDHRASINENTCELETVYEFMNELARKLDKLAERVDDIALRVNAGPKERSFEFEPLSSREKEVFRAIYELTECRAYVAVDDVARRCMLTRELVGTHIAAIARKGVPLTKRCDNGRGFVRIDPAFRSLQARKNVIGLDAPLTCWMR